MNDMQRYQQWLSDPAIDEATKAELRQIADDAKEIKEMYHHNRNSVSDFYAFYCYNQDH